MTITTSAPPPFAPPPFASPEDRGPLRFLPALLFEDRRPALTILVAWALTLAGSVALGFLLSRIAPQGAGPNFGKAPAWMLLIGIALFSPIVETLMMGGLLALLGRWLRPWRAVVASAALWGVFHSLLAPLWGLVVWWPFLIFSTLFVTWRRRGFWTAVAIAASVHVLQNAIPAVAAMLGF